MKIRRLYRKWDHEDCHINISVFKTRRIMPLFNPHFHGEMEIIYIDSGVYEVYTAEGNLRLESGTVYIVPPYELHSIRSLALDGMYICFAIDASAVSMSQKHPFQKGFAEPLQTGRLRMPRMFKNGDPGSEELVEHIKKLMKLKKDAPNYFLKRFQYIMDLCIELMPYCTVAETNGEENRTVTDLASRCTRYMHEHYAEKISITSLAEHVHVHPNYLCTAFKKNTGITVLEYLNKIRVNCAVELLHRNEYTVGQVAERCGFSSVSTFQRVFKAYTGITPGNFAKVYK